MAEHIVYDIGLKYTFHDDETDISSSQNNDLPFPWNIIFKAIYFYSTNEEVRNTVNGLMNYVAPKAKDFFAVKLCPL